MTADLTEWGVIEAIKRSGSAAYADLARRYPEKIVRARFERMVSAGFLEYGVSLETAWLVAPGRWEREPHGAPLEMAT